MGSRRGAASRRVVYVAIAADIGIAAAKFFVAALTGSSAMFAEGVHSLVDMGNELLLLHGGRRGRRAVDEEHAFGYGKKTYVWSLLVALSVFSIGGGVLSISGQYATGVRNMYEGAQTSRSVARTLPRMRSALSVPRAMAQEGGAK